MVKIVIGIFGLCFCFFWGLYVYANDSSFKNSKYIQTDSQGNKYYTQEVQDNYYTQNIDKQLSTQVTNKQTTTSKQTTKKTTTSATKQIQENTITYKQLFENAKIGFNTIPTLNEEWMNYATRLDAALTYGFPDDKRVTKTGKNTILKRNNIDYYIKIGNCTLQMDNHYYFTNNTGYMNIQYFNINDYKTASELYNLFKNYFSNRNIAKINESGTEWFIYYDNGTSINLINSNGIYNFSVHYTFDIY